MSEVLKTVLSLTCSGVLLIAAFCLLRPLVRKRLSKRWQYYIWLVVVARLLIPYTPEMNLMGMVFQQIDYGISQIEIDMSANPNQAFDQNTADEHSSSDKGIQGKIASGGNAAKWFSVDGEWIAVVGRYIWILWAITALALFIRKITIYQSFVKYIRAGSAEVEQIELLEQFGRLVAESGVKTTVELAVNPLISSPLLIGFFRPRIVFPTTDLSDSDFRYTVLHELTHFKRGDMFYKWLVQVAICIHWFNPFIYFMGREVERACELACDEAVIRDLDASQQRAYGDTLINAIGSGGRYKDSIAAVTLCEGTKLLQERLGAIMGFHKKAQGVRICSITLACIISVGAVFVGAYSPHVGAKPPTSGDLKLFTVEYTVEELVESEIAKINVQTISDDITVVRGGDTVLFEYYAVTPKEYQLTQTSNMVPAEEAKKQNSPPFYNVLSLSRIQGASSAVGDRSITITVPEEFPIQALDLRNTTGNIHIDGASFSMVNVVTQTGTINMVGGVVEQGLRIQTESGDARISETVLPARNKGDTDIQTQSGLIMIQPMDSPINYCIEVDYGDEATVMINDLVQEKSTFWDEYAIEEPDGSLTYPPEAWKRINQFTVQEDGASVIYFTSPKGTLRLLGK